MVVLNIIATLLGIAAGIAVGTVTGSNAWDAVAAFSVSFVLNLAVFSARL